MDDLNALRELIFTGEVHNIELAIITAHGLNLSVKNILGDFIRNTEIRRFNIFDCDIKIRRSKNMRYQIVNHTIKYIYDNVLYESWRPDFAAIHILKLTKNKYEI